MTTILDLCGGTGSWSKPYKDAGYDVITIDIEYGGKDVRLYEYNEKDDTHGILAAPPCTNLSVSGARWWKGKSNDALLESLSIVDACLRIIHAIKPCWWALENPVGRLSKYIGPPKFTFQPWEYGDPWAKRTCLWGNFTIPTKTPVKRDRNKDPWRLPPSKERSKLRSITPSGFANAFFKANP